MEFAKNHMTWNLEWRNVLWSDEKKFNLDGPDGFRYYWHDLRKNERILSKRQMGGGSVMIWACFSSDFKGEIVFIDSRMDAQTYRNMITPHLNQVSNHFGTNRWIFQQDNAPIHRAKENIDWFKRQNIKLLDWPALSPDLNPIENLWGLLANAVYDNGKQFESVNDLKRAISREWAKMDIQELRNVVESMPNRIFEVIRLHGSKTKY